MFAAISLFVSACFFASGTLYIVLFVKKKRRKSDLWLSLVGYALGVSFLLYTFERVSPVVHYSEVIIDGLIGIILLWNLRKLVKFTFLERPHAGDH